jgi:hypothetical protein
MLIDEANNEKGQNKLSQARIKFEEAFVFVSSLSNSCANAMRLYSGWRSAH